MHNSIRLKVFISLHVWLCKRGTSLQLLPVGGWIRETARFCPCAEGPKYLPAVHHSQSSSPPPEDPWSLPYESFHRDTHAQPKLTSVSHAYETCGFIYMGIFINVHCMMQFSPWCMNYLITKENSVSFYFKRRIYFLILSLSRKYYILPVSEAKSHPHKLSCWLAHTQLWISFLYIPIALFVQSFEVHSKSYNDV